MDPINVARLAHVHTRLCIGNYFNLTTWLDALEISIKFILLANLDYNLRAAELH